MSSLPSPLKSPTAGISEPTAKKSCHFTPVPTNDEPVDSATYTSAAAPRVNVTMSSLPSPLKSPTAGVSEPTAKKSCHFTPVPENDEPVDSATYTSAAGPLVKVAMSSLPSPLKSPTSGVSDPTAKKSCHFTPVPENAEPVDNATYTSAAGPRVKVTMSSRPSPLKSPATPLKPPPTGGAAAAGTAEICAVIVRAVTAASATRRRLFSMILPVQLMPDSADLPSQKLAVKAALVIFQSACRPARAKPT